MQRDMFMATLINDRARPAVALPPTTRVRSAHLIGPQEVRSGEVTAVGRDATGALCVELVRLGVPETHLQVYDGAVACFFTGITDAARSHAVFLESVNEDAPSEPQD